VQQGRNSFKRHPRSPVQPGPSNVPYFIAAVVAAVAIWAFQQSWIQDADQTPASHKNERLPAGSAKGDLRSLFSGDDYPAIAQARGEQGTVRAELAVDDRGRVTGCSIRQSSGFAALDNATCRILQRRARFTPARDVDGKAIPDKIMTPAVVWRLEG
jgi:protein TonB